MSWGIAGDEAGTGFELLSNISRIFQWFHPARRFLAPAELPKGSLRNKFTILCVEAPVGQGAKTQEYRDISSFRNAARRDASAHKM